MSLLSFQYLNFSFRRSVPLILQSEISECGPVCVAMLAGYFGKHIDLAGLRVTCQRLGFSPQGTNLSELISLANELQLNGTALKGEVHELLDVRLPCILHWQLQHFVVLTKITRRNNQYEYHINDPAEGEVVVNAQDFSAAFTGIVLTLAKQDTFQTTAAPKKISFRGLFGHCSGLTKQFAIILTLSFILQLLSLAIPLYTQIIFDEVFALNASALLNSLAIGFTGLVIFQVAISALREWSLVKLQSILGIQLAHNVFAHLLKLPYQYFSKRHIGDIQSRFGSIQSIQERMTSGLLATLIDGIMAFFLIILMFLYAWKLALCVVVAVLIYSGIKWVCFYKVQKHQLVLIKHDASLQTHFLETLRHIKTFTLFNLQKRREQTWLVQQSHVVNSGIKVALWHLVLNHLQQIIFGLVNIGVLYLGAKEVLQQGLSMGMLIAFMAYKNQCTQRLTGLVDQLFQFKLLHLHMDRVADIALAEVDSPDVPQGSGELAKIRQGSPKRQLELVNVSFAYPGQPPILENINLQVDMGDSVVITGESGSGKTTLLHIMLGLLKPTTGEVRYNGHNIYQMGISDYRQHIAAVLQGEHLLNGNVLENITMFAEQPNLQKCGKALEQAHMVEALMSLPLGLYTLVGGLGNIFSGGQIQRLLLARALYKEPNILFLDEATSHLDSRTEQQISRVIANLTLTRICIAHRSETIAQFSRKLCLKDGNLNHMV